jgi:hypothetical protein
MNCVNIMSLSTKVVTTTNMVKRLHCLPEEISRASATSAVILVSRVWTVALLLINLTTKVARTDE